MAVSIKIEKGIPVPPVRGVWPFGEMEVGDSFLIPAGREKAGKASAWTYGKKHGMRFAVRTEKKGTRIWRTE